MEIHELKNDIETFFGDGRTGYEDCMIKKLLVLAQQGDKQAKLQILTNFKGLIYNTLAYNGYYLQPVNSFEFHRCRRTPQVEYLMLSLGRLLYIANSEYSSFTVWTTRVSNPV